MYHLVAGRFTILLIATVSLLSTVVALPLLDYDDDTDAFLALNNLILERDERDSNSGDASGEEDAIFYDWMGNVTQYTDVWDKDVHIKKLHIRSLRVTSSITARFAQTVVVSHVINPAIKDQEVNFHMSLPGDAFISGFLIEADGEVYRSRVDEKAKAQRTYDAAKKRGQTAGQVKQTSEKTNAFTISINVASNSSLSFNLTYEELLKRKDGYFENFISISPGQVVEHLNVNVYINEPQGIQEGSVDFYVRPIDPADGKSPENLRPLWADVKYVRSNQAHVTFHPSAVHQAMMSTNGNLGKFVVRYDVVHGLNGGRIEIVNGYFVHHFSPSGFPPARKNVVFVLDTSGSMSGNPLSQTKRAMYTILADLRQEDWFGVITFSSETRALTSLIPANKPNTFFAHSAVSRLHPHGGTNLHGGLVDAIAMLDTAEYVNPISYKGTFSLIILLTDGQPSAGTLTDPDDITTDIRRQIEGRYSLFCLGFGLGVNYPLLEKLSLQNGGVARKIYDDSSARLQLVGFYDEVATPLLVNIKIQYENSVIVTDSISQNSFPSYFEGTELVVAGQLVDAPSNGSLPSVLTCFVTAETNNTKIQFEVEVDIEEESEAVLSPHVVDDFARRMWAFVTIKELLQGRIAADGVAERKALTERALNLSLAHHFVTPLTSLVVVKPEETLVKGGSGPTAAEEGEKKRPPLVASSPTGDIKPIVQYHSWVRPTSAPIVIAPTTFSSVASVDSDPHFLVHTSRGNVTVCFDIMGLPGDVFSLIEDAVLGYYVTGHVASVYTSYRTDYPKANGVEAVTAPTIFDQLTMSFGSLDLVVTSKAVAIGSSLLMPWNTTWSAIVEDELVLTVRESKYLTIQPQKGITLVVMRHDVERHHPTKVDYLGLYIVDGKGFSHEVHGIIGQFEYRKIKLVDRDNENRLVSYIHVKDRNVEVTRSEKKNLLTGGVEPCWYATNNAFGLLDGIYRDYLTLTDRQR